MQTVIAHAIDVAARARNFHGAARHREHIRVHTQEDANVHGGVGDQFHLVVGNRAEHFSHVPGSAGHDLPRQAFGVTGPDAAREGIPGDFHGLIGRELPAVRARQYRRARALV